MLKKAITWGGIALLVFFLAFRPGLAAGILRSVGDTAVDIVGGVSDFFAGLVSQ